MSYDSSFDSRSERYERRRKNTKKINLIIVLVGILFLSLVGIFLFGGSDDENEAAPVVSDIDSNDDNEQDDDKNVEDETTENGQDNDQINNEDNTDENSESNVDSETDNQANEHADPNDSNVKEVINQVWDPYPTEQEEPHIIDLNADSQDRIEIELAIAYAIDASRDNLTYWWLESGGIPDRIVGTVEVRDTNEIYRVELRWITNQGWQPQRVEILYENDQLWRFQDDNNEDEE